RRRLAAREAWWQAAESLRLKCDRMLAWPLYETVVEHYDDGRPKTVITPTRWSFATAVSFARTIADLSRLALDPAGPHGSPGPTPIVVEADAIDPAVAAAALEAAQRMSDG